MNKENTVEELIQTKKDLEEARRKLSIAGTNVDFSENNDWNVLNEKVINLERKKDILENEIEFLEDKNNYLATITYENISNGEINKFKLTRFIRSNPKEGNVSLNSPLGLALYNKKVGETTFVKTENGSYEVKIIAIEIIN